MSPKTRYNDAALYEMGGTGLDWSSGVVLDEFHPKLAGRQAVEVYRTMRDNCAVIGAFELQKDAHITQAGYSVQESKEGGPQSKLARDLAEQSLEDMDGSFTDELSDMLTFPAFGFSLHEPVFKIRRGDHELSALRSKHDDGRFGIRKIAVRRQETIDRWEFDESGEWLAAVQRFPTNLRDVTLPRERLLHITTQSNRGNPQGRSVYRNAYRSWWYLERIQQLEAIGVEKDMAGVLVFQVPAEYMVEGATSAQQAQVEAYRQMVERARAGKNAGFVVPSKVSDDGTPTGFELSALQSGGRRPMDVDGIIKRLESRIAVSFLGEGVLLGMQGDTGSWALSSSKTRSLALVLGGFMRRIEEAMNQVFLRLTLLNGLPGAVAPTFEFGDIEKEDLTEMSTALGAFADRGFVGPTPEIERYILQKLELPFSETPTLASVDPSQLADRLAEAAETPEGDDDTGRAVLDSMYPLPEAA